MIEALDIRVRGIVQGVGFRPFVYRLARRYLINGWVLNDLDGVFIHAEGETKLLDEFVTELHMNPPAAAVVREVELKEVPLQDCTRFEIRESQTADADEGTLVSADLATCDDRLRALLDPSDRRYRYRRNKSNGVGQSGGTHLWLRLRNDAHVVTAYWSHDGKEWQRETWGQEVSGFNHNTLYDFQSILPGLFCEGEGYATFSNFKYRELR